ncbi:DUF3993 domain-containing protein [Bacillus massilinigeriensis]|uniref:DUF3993 domain-containing protein n=1 Tax=Bacillus massilionigeriensis TaxID=1805475 RepID=UPI00096B1A33|nr:DUF3993 domain-containing protein [Bacillus massilionigeriensis]
MRLLLKLIIVASVMFIFPGADKAEGDIDSREKVMKLLEDAYLAQVSLNEKPRSMKEIKQILSPYFTEGYMKLFLKENLVSEKGKYLTYGSDFAPYYVPFFAFTNRTKVVIEEKRSYVFEYFPDSDVGPVTYPSHYEGLLFKKISGKWKISNYLYDTIPKRVIEKAKRSVN